MNTNRQVEENTLLVTLSLQQESCTIHAVTSPLYYIDKIKKVTILFKQGNMFASLVTILGQVGNDVGIHSTYLLTKVF